MVSHTLDSFVASDLKIVGEIMLEVRHALLVGAPSPPNIARVCSHPQALAQCARWLDAHLPDAARIATASTALAAARCHDDPHAAAIASIEAAAVHHLVVLHEDIQDADDNVTRFLIIGPDATPPDQARKTSLLLALPDKPGALYEVLRPLSEASINLTKIQSRPSPGKAWEYIFFLDVDGHAEREPLAGALAILRADCPLFKVLGVY